MSQSLNNPPRGGYKTRNTKMKFKIFIDQKEAIKNGNEKWGRQIVDVALSDLTAEERAQIAGFRISDDNICDLSDHHFYNNSKYKKITYPIFSDTENAIEKVTSALNFYRERDEINQQQKIDDFKMQKNDLDKKINAAIENPELLISSSGVFVELPWCYNDNELKNYCQQRLAETVIVAKKIIEDKENARKIAYEKRQIEESKKLADLKCWALESGSEKTKLLIENDFDGWVSSARNDFASAHLPGGYELGASDGEERKSPTLEELKEFSKIKKLCENQPDLYTNPKIEYIKKDDYDCETEEFVEIQLQIICLDGHKRWVSKRIEIQ